MAKHLRIQSVTITRNYPGGEIATQRITVCGPYAVGDKIVASHVWAGWTVTEVRECSL